MTLLGFGKTIVIAANQRCPSMAGSKRRFLVVGIVLVVVGLGLVIIGVLGLVSPIACAINGCPSKFSGYYASNWGEILAGVALVAIGLAIAFPWNRAQKRTLNTSPATMTPSASTTSSSKKRESATRIINQVETRR